MLARAYASVLVSFMSSWFAIRKVDIGCGTVLPVMSPWLRRWHCCSGTMTLRLAQWYRGWHYGTGCDSIARVMARWHRLRLNSIGTEPFAQAQGCGNNRWHSGMVSGTVDGALDVGRLGWFGLSRFGLNWTIGPTIIENLLCFALIIGI